MKLMISERCKYSFISSLMMFYFVIMFPPVKYEKIGLMYGYCGFDEGEVCWMQLIIEIIVVTFISGIIYLIYPKYKKN